MSYFTFTSRFQPGTKAKAEQVNSVFDRIVNAFADAESDIDAATAAAAEAQQAATTATATATSVSGSATAAVAAAQAALDAANSKLPLAGGSLQGPLTLAGYAAAALQPVPLQQLQAILGGYAALGSNPAFGNELVLFYAPGGADQKRWDFLATDGALQLRSINDAFSAATAALTIYRNGYTISGIHFGSDSVVIDDVPGNVQFRGRLFPNNGGGLGWGRLFVQPQSAAIPALAEGDVVLQYAG